MKPDLKLDRRPVVLQVRDALRRQIASGEIASGDQLPTEAECAAMYGVSRATVREAYKLLEQEGLTVVRRGLGTFVLPNAKQQTNASVTLFRSMTEFLTSLGYTVSSRVLSVGSRTPTQEETQALHLPRGSRVIDLERFRLGNGEPLVYSRCAFDERLLDGTSVEQADWNGSVMALLESHGHRLLSAVIDVQAVNLPQEVATQYSLPLGTPWLLMAGTNFDEKGNPILTSRDYIRGDIRTLRVVQRPGG